jgi:hypothetical protein
MAAESPWGFSPLTLRLLGPGGKSPGPFCCMSNAIAGTSDTILAQSCRWILGTTVSYPIALAEVIVALRQYLKCLSGVLAFIEVRPRKGVSMITDLENRRVKELEKRIADLERLVDWVTGLLIDFVAVVIAIGAAIFVAGGYYRLSAVDGAVVIAFVVTMFSLNFIFRKVARWCFDG